MSAISNSAAANMLNATLPTATGGKPTATFWTAGGYSTAGAMYIRLNSVAYSGSNPGSTEQTELTGTGYTTHGTLLGASSAATVVSNVETVTLPAAATSWTNGSGSSWSVNSLDITDNALAWAWFGNWNGNPVSVANGNTFQVAANAVTVTLS